MGCDFPIKAYRSPEFNPATGKRLLTFNPIKSVDSTTPLDIPCGRCMGCRLDRSQQWGIRCLHESKMHEENSYLTLTFSDEHLPVDYSVSTRDMQLFMKRLRKAVHPKQIRFYLGAEYGDQLQRPHYHIILFGHDFADKLKFKKNKQGQWLYTSQSLDQLWPYGHATLGDVTFESACYVARYCTKKIGGDEAANHYLRVHPLHGFICRVKPEFSLMSRKPGIGQSFFEKFRSDMFPSDQVIVNGRAVSMPRYYVKQLSEKEATLVSRERRKKALVYKPHKTNRRRHDRVIVRNAKISQLKRDYE